MAKLASFFGGVVVSNTHKTKAINETPEEIPPKSM